MKGKEPTTSRVQNWILCPVADLSPAKPENGAYGYQCLILPNLCRPLAECRQDVTTLSVAYSARRHESLCGSIDESAVFVEVTII